MTDVEMISDADTTALSVLDDPLSPNYFRHLQYLLCSEEDHAKALAEVTKIRKQACYDRECAYAFNLHYS